MLNASLTGLMDGTFVLVTESELIHGTRAGLTKQMRLIGLSKAQIEGLFDGLIEGDEDELSKGVA